MSNKYNGWTNYETWNVNLWLTNDQSEYENWIEVACSHLYFSDGLEGDESTCAERAENSLANELSNDFDERIPDGLTGAYKDLLGAALSEVNWGEIAKHLIEAAHEANA